MIVAGWRSLRQGRNFLVKHMYAGGGKWCEKVRSDGTLLQGLGENVYGWLFAAVGLAEYYRAAKRAEDLDLAKTSLVAALRTYDDPGYTDTHTTQYTGLDLDPRGLRSQGHSMVTIAMLTGLLAHHADPALEDLQRRHVALVLDKFWNPRYRIVNEYLRHDFSRAPGAEAHMLTGACHRDPLVADGRSLAPARSAPVRNRSRPRSPLAGNVLGLHF